jgi:hypothetical protein
MGKANSHGWDETANLALLEAMNLRFRPNAEDCKELSVQLGVRGFKFSAGATLYASSPFHPSPSSSSLSPARSFPLFFPTLHFELRFSTRRHGSASPCLDTSRSGTMRLMIIS